MVEEEKKIPRHESNVTEEEPSMAKQDSDSIDSDEEPNRKFSRSQSKIPKMDLEPES